MRQYGSWSIAAGISTGTFLPSMTDGRKHGAACTGGKPIMPMLVELVKPNTALAVENVMRLAISVASGYRYCMCFVSTIIFVFLGLKPMAIMSSMFSYVYRFVSSRVLSCQYRNFSSSVIWKSRFEPNLSCKYFANIHGMTWPMWTIPEGPRPV